MSNPTSPWRNTTHDWAGSVDARHLAAVRQHPAVFAPGGVLHLILAVVAFRCARPPSAGSDEDRG